MCTVAISGVCVTGTHLQCFLDFSFYAYHTNIKTSESMHESFDYLPVASSIGSFSALSLARVSAIDVCREYITQLSLGRDSKL